MKNKPQKKTILKILCAIAFVFVLVGVVTYFSPNVLADAGNNNRYEVDTNTSSSSDGDSDLFYFLWWFLFEMIGPIPGIIVLPFTSCQLKFLFSALDTKNEPSLFVICANTWQ